MSDLRAILGDKYDDVIEKARLAIEDELIELRGMGVFVTNRNGLTVNNRDGSHSGIRRMSTAMGVHIALAAVLPDLMADVWDEGHADGLHNAHEYREHRKARNPYRPETTAGRPEPAPEPTNSPNLTPSATQPPTEPHNPEGA